MVSHKSRDSDPIPGNMVSEDECWPTKTYGSLRLRYYVCSIHNIKGCMSVPSASQMFCKSKSKYHSLQLIRAFILNARVPKKSSSSLHCSKMLPKLLSLNLPTFSVWLLVSQRLKVPFRISAGVLSITLKTHINMVYATDLLNLRAITAPWGAGAENLFHSRRAPLFVALLTLCGAGRYHPAGC